MQPYQHFTISERENLYQMKKDGKKQCEIAKALNKSESAVSRELKRNSDKDGSYNVWKAMTLYLFRRQNCRNSQRIECDEPLLLFIKKSFKKYHSPEIITAKWKMKNPGAKLSHSTIYSALKRGLIDKATSKTHLRRHGQRKKCHNTKTIKPEHTIHERPEIIEVRGRLGDWEGDTVMGLDQKSALVTFVDRKSRLLTAKIIIGKTALATKEGVEKALKGFVIESITLDQGSEFALFKDFEKSLNTTVYFADVRSPWQRGSNENLNGLIRFFFPKGTDFRTMSDYKLKKVISLINERPRKCLGWLSPTEVYFSKSCT